MLYMQRLASLLAKNVSSKSFMMGTDQKFEFGRVLKVIHTEKCFGISGKKLQWILSKIESSGALSLMKVRFQHYRTKTQLKKIERNLKKI